MTELVASWEPGWSDEGLLGASQVHVDVPASVADEVVALVGGHLCVRLEPTSLRLDPSVSLATFAALLRAAGWQVTSAPSGLVAGRAARPSGR